jgi:hypothetical protein
MTEHPLATWHRLVRTQDPAGLDALLADEAVFYSPVVHTPQRGKTLAAAYLSAAFEVFFSPSFRYVRRSSALRTRCSSSRPKSTGSRSTAST